jgi:hypothetical protein
MSETIPSHHPVPDKLSRRRQVLSSGAPTETQTALRGGPMHYIAVDLDTEAWVKSGLARLERYLACWRLFNDQYPA